MNHERLLVDEVPPLGTEEFQSDVLESDTVVGKTQEFLQMSGLKNQQHLSEPDVHCGA